MSLAGRVAAWSSPERPSIGGASDHLPRGGRGLGADSGEPAGAGSSTVGYGSAAVSVIGRGTIRLVWRVRVAGERTRVSWLMPWFAVPFEGPCDRTPSAMRIAQHTPSPWQAGAPDSA